MIVANNLRKLYHRGTEEVEAVKDISLDIKEGEFVSFVGPSGSGKTTLINILGCLDNPTSGEMYINDVQIFNGKYFLSERKLTHIRRENFGYIFQKFYLIPTLSVKDNILLPFAFYKNNDDPLYFKHLTESLGIDKRLNHLPSQISGGEMQRVAIARALVNKPKILLADEPTGNLDSKRSDEIGAVLKNLNQEHGITIILVTHNPHLARTADRVVEIRDGEIFMQTDQRLVTPL